MTVSKNIIYYDKSSGSRIFKNNSHLLECPECFGSVISDFCHGETKCTKCGLILSENNIDPYFEKRLYPDSEHDIKIRVGPPITVFIIDIWELTKIHIKDFTTSDFKRIAQKDKKYDNRRNKSLPYARDELRRIGAHLRIPETFQAIGFLLCKKAMKQKMALGRSIENLVAGCLYYACRKVQLPIALHEIVNCTYKRNSKKVQKTYSALFREFSLKVPPMGPEHFLSRYISELNLSFEFEKKARKLLKMMPMNLILGKDPKGICAGILHFLGKKENIILTQKYLSEITGSKRISIQSQYKRIKTYFDLKLAK